MLSILNTLNGQDLGFIKIIANAWGIEIKGADAYTARTQLATEMENQDVIKELYDSFPENAKLAFDTLLENDGKITWAKFARDFGEIQVMGSAKRDRERPDLNPVNPTEFLWYRAFIGRAFLSTDTEPQEFAYIPEEIFSTLKPAHIKKHQLPGRPASSKETQVVFNASETILDDICTLLSAYRNEFSQDFYEDFLQIPPKFLIHLLTDLKIISKEGDLEPDQVRILLETPSEKFFAILIRQWVEQIHLNEMSFLPEIEIEGVLDRNHYRARQYVIEQLSQVPVDTWWNLESFISYIFQVNPDFQRPAGNYDSWYIKDITNGKFLRGFEFWNEVDGALIRFMITGPMFWLGLVDLASSQHNPVYQAFRLSTRFTDFLTNQTPIEIKPQETKITIDSYGKIFLSKNFSRTVRYQISRFCEWGIKEKDGFHFQITPSSLHRATQQGLTINHITKILQSNLPHSFPPKLKLALENWEKHGIQAHFSNVILLSVGDPQAVERLQSSPANKFIQAVLNPTTVSIHPHGIEQVKKALIDLGFLSE